MNSEYHGYLQIPAQYQLDGSLFYKTRKWETWIEFTTITNQHNWEPSEGGTYGEEGIVSAPGAQVFASIRYKY